MQNWKPWGILIEIVQNLQPQTPCWFLRVISWALSAICLRVGNSSNTTFSSCIHRSRHCWLVFWWLKFFVLKCPWRLTTLLLRDALGITAKRLTPVCWDLPSPSRCFILSGGGNKAAKLVLILRLIFWSLSRWLCLDNNQIKIALSFFLLAPPKVVLSCFNMTSSEARSTGEL